MNCEQPKTEDVSRLTKEETISRCRLLYDKSSLAWECGYGWYNKISELSYKLETLNLIFFPKYRVKIVASQIKEKFGTLCFYYDILKLQPKILTFHYECLERLAEWMSKKYHIEYGYDSKATRTKLVFSMAEDRKNIGNLDPDFKHPMICMDDTIQYDSKTKYNTKTGQLMSQYRSRPIAKNHKIADFTIRTLRSIAWFLRRITPFMSPSKEQSVIASSLFNECNKIIEEYTEKCYRVCEDCGDVIDDKTRCKTSGWITYLCEECVKKRNLDYDKNGKHYKAEKKK